MIFCHLSPPPHIPIPAAELPGSNTALELVKSIRQKCTPEQVMELLLKDLPNSNGGGGGLGGGDGGDAQSLGMAVDEAALNPLKIEVFVQTLLNLGSKSFSHSFAAISKFHECFKQLADSEEAQICVLQNVFELWKNHQQMICVIVDKLLKTQIVECSAVATWIFSKEMGTEFTKMYLWEVLHLTIKKMNKHVIKLGHELQEAREILAKADDSSSSEEEDESSSKRRKVEAPEKPTEEVGCL